MNLSELLSINLRYYRKLYNLSQERFAEVIGTSLSHLNKMEQQKVDMYIMSNQKYFPAEKIMYLKEKLLSMDEAKFSMVSCVELKDPTTVLIISLLLGVLGIDRFMIGDTGLGILKLLTGGCCGILAIIDWFTVPKKAKEVNFNKLMTLI